MEIKEVYKAIELMCKNKFSLETHGKIENGKLRIVVKTQISSQAIDGAKLSIIIPYIDNHTYWDDDFFDEHLSVLAQSIENWLNFPIETAPDGELIFPDGSRIRPEK